MYFFFDYLLDYMKNQQKSLEKCFKILNILITGFEQTQYWGVAKLVRHRPLKPTFLGSNPNTPDFFNNIFKTISAKSDFFCISKINIALIIIVK